MGHYDLDDNYEGGADLIDANDRVQDCFLEEYGLDGNDEEEED